MRPIPPQTFETKPPMAMATLDLTLTNLLFERSGIFTFELLVDGVPVGARDFFVELAQRDEEPPRY